MIGFQAVRFANPLVSGSSAPGVPGATASLDGFPLTFSSNRMFFGFCFFVYLSCFFLFDNIGIYPVCISLKTHQLSLIFWKLLISVSTSHDPHENDPVQHRSAMIRRHKNTTHLAQLRFNNTSTYSTHFIIISPPDPRVPEYSLRPLASRMKSDLPCGLRTRCVSSSRPQPSAPPDGTQNGSPGARHEAARLISKTRCHRY